MAEVHDAVAEVRGDHEDLLRRRASALAVPPPAVGERRSEEAVVLRVGARRFALPANRVREILPPGPLTGVPRGEHLLVGVRASRGGAVPVADITALTGDGRIADPSGCLCVVLDGPDPLGILADGATALERDETEAPVAPDGDALGSLAPDGVLVLDIDAVLGHPRLRIQAPTLLPTPPRSGGPP